MDPRYTAAAERYCRALAEVIRPWQITQGGPIIMLQVENDTEVTPTIAVTWPGCTISGGSSA